MKKAARQKLDELQREFPPAYPKTKNGLDRAQNIAIELVPFLPPALLDLIKTDQLVIGEVGDWKPGMYTHGRRELGDGNYLIAVNSGSMDFHYAVARTLQGRAKWHGLGGIAGNDFAISFNDMIALLRASLEDWRSFCHPSILQELAHLWSDPDRIEHGQFAIADEPLQHAEEVATHAERFMIAHEFGHSAIQSGAFQPVWGEAREEVNADIFGVELVLRRIQGQDEQLRSALEGICLAVRVTGCITNMGIEFHGKYPNPQERLLLILKRLREIFPSQRFLDEVSTVMVSMLDQLDHADEILSPARFKLDHELQEWQSRVRTISILESIIRYNVSEVFLIEDWKGWSALISRQKMLNVHQTLIEYYGGSNSDATRYSDELAVEIGNCLKRLNLLQFNGLESH